MMQRFTKSIAAAAGTAMLVLSTAAAAAPAANPAASLSVARSARPATPAAKASKIGASVPGATLVSIGILAALTAVVLVATDEGSDSN